MTRTAIHPVIQGCIGVHEAFRRLGFPSNDIFVALNNSNNIASTVLRAQGKEFVVGIGPFDRTYDDFKKCWELAAKAINAGHVSNIDLDAMYRASVVFSDPVGFLQAIKNKGIQIPREQGLG